MSPDAIVESGTHAAAEIFAVVSLATADFAESFATSTRSKLPDACFLNLHFESFYYATSLLDSAADKRLDDSKRLRLVDQVNDTLSNLFGSVLSGSREESSSELRRETVKTIYYRAALQRFDFYKTMRRRLRWRLAIYFGLEERLNEQLLAVSLDDAFRTSGIAPPEELKQDFIRKLVTGVREAVGSVYL